MKRLIIIPLLFLTLIASATNYYVATAAGGGNNNNPGTLAQPFLTINYAESKLANGVGGDTIFVRGGTYNASVLFYLSSGTAGNPNVLINYPTESPIIDGTGISIGGGSALVYLYAVSYIEINGFEIQNCRGSNTVIAIQAAGGGSNNTFKNLTVHDSDGTGINMFTSYSLVDNCTVYDCAESNDDGHLSSRETWGAGINVRGVNHVTVRNCTIHDIWGEGLSTTSSNYTLLEDNTIYDVANAHWYVMNSQDAIVQRTIMYTTKAKGDATMVSVGLGHWNELSSNLNARNTLINNVAYGCERNFYTYGARNGLVLAFNTFVNSSIVACIQVDYNAGDYNSLIANNIIIQDGALPNIYSYTPNAQIVWSHNFWSKAHDADATGAGDVIDVTGAHFIDSANLDFRLKASSLAIAAGLDMDILVDYSGTYRDDNNPTIGAYEYDGPPPVVKPTVTTQSVLYSTTQGAIATGIVLSDGGGTISARGVCWSTAVNPDLTDNVVTVSGTTGYFEATILGLTQVTTYYVCAYATNEIGTSYGNIIIVDFTTTESSLLFEGKKQLYDRATGKKLEIR
jgi:parallel beta-helix repeat protein